jgi:hypothetical protein
MGSTEEVQREIQLLAQRIEQLRELQRSQKHLPFVGVHLEEHIDKLQARIDEMLRLPRAS